MLQNAYNKNKIHKKGNPKMSSKTIMNEYGKIKVTIKDLTAQMKKLEPQIYSIMVEEGLQSIGKKTYTFNTAKYQIKITEADSSEVVDWKALALYVLKMDEKTAKKYAFEKGLINTRKGAITYNADKIE